MYSFMKKRLPERNIILYAFFYCTSKVFLTKLTIKVLPIKLKINTVGFKDSNT